MNTPHPTLAIYTADRWEHVCPVLRLLHPAEQSGFGVVRGNEWEDGALRVFPERVAQADAVIIQRDFPTHVEAYEAVAAQARRLGKPLVYELDDLLPELPEPHPDVVHYLSARTAILRAIAEADAVVGSTPPLREYLAGFNPNAWLLPNYLDDRLWSLRSPTPGAPGPVVIGYLGGHSHSYDLEEATPALKRLLQRYGRQVTLRFWGVPPPLELRSLGNVEWINVGLVDYAQFVRFFMEQHCDLFIAPLRDNLFNRCKSPLKFLEYSALGIPGVYSRVTPYVSVVRHGVNGFLAGAPEEWEQHLVTLVEDPALRLQMSSEAQADVRNGWLLSDHAKQWAETYRQILVSSRAAAPSAASPEFAENVARKMHAWQQDLERRVQAQAQELQTLRRTAAEKEKSFQKVYGLYKEILDSRAWRWMQKIVRLRQKLLPRGSKTERAARTALHTLSLLRGASLRPALGYLRREGIAVLRYKGPPPAKIADADQPIWLSVSMLNGSPLPQPAISVILVSGEADAPDEAGVHTWLANQTLPSAGNLVVWDRAQGLAYPAGEPSRAWPAASARAVCAGLPTPYLCLASRDLLHQEETYLEANLMALAGEGLAFTVNLRGGAGWAVNRIASGLLPGNAGLPLLRVVASKECVQDDFTLDLAALFTPGDDLPRAVGKILLHTTNYHDDESLLPFERSLPAGDKAFVGPYILTRPSAVIPWGITGHVLHPLDTVLPGAPVPDERPTVFMVQTYLAVGGAEQIHLKVMQNLKDKIRFVVLTFEPLDPELGTTADAFRQVTPYVYTLPDYLHPELYGSLVRYLVGRFDPRTLYIGNGATWIYNALAEIKSFYPKLRIVDQVYDSKVGWINRYDVGVVMHTDGHIGVNSKICQAYIEKGAKPEQVYLIENGIQPSELDPGAYPPEKIEQLKARFGLPCDKKVVTFASRIHPQKRPLDFVELARRFASDPSVAFLMVGDGPLAGRVDEQAAKIGLANFHHRPFYRPISDVLAITDVFVLPSDFEGMPMIIIEAQAMGKPVVVTDVGNNREVVEYTQGGVVIPQIGDVAALAGGVRRMLDNPPDPLQLRQAVLDRFDIAVVAEKYRQALL